MRLNKSNCTQSSSTTTVLNVDRRPFSYDSCFFQSLYSSHVFTMDHFLLGNCKFKRVVHKSWLLLKTSDLFLKYDHFIFAEWRLTAIAIYPIPNGFWGTYYWRATVIFNDSINYGNLPTGLRNRGWCRQNLYTVNRGSFDFYIQRKDASMTIGWFSISGRFTIG